MLICNITLWTSCSTNFALFSYPEVISLGNPYKPSHQLHGSMFYVNLCFRSVKQRPILYKLGYSLKPCGACTVMFDRDSVTTFHNSKEKQDRLRAALIRNLHEDFNDFQVTSIHQPNVGPFKVILFIPLNEQPCNTFSSPERIFSACEDTFLNKMQLIIWSPFS